MDGYSFEKLSNSLEICVSKQHRFGTDAFLLSQFAKVKRKDKTLDLCTGCGIVALLWFRQIEDAPKFSYCIDIQDEAIYQLEKTIHQANLTDRIFPIKSDLKDLKGKVPFGSFDVITCNPPYKATSTGILNSEDSHSIARHEILCSIFDVCQVASKLLQYGGRLCICQRPERLADTLEAMRKYKIEPKLLRFVQKNGDSAPWLFLIEGRKGGKPFLRVEAPLLIQDKSGGFSEELKNIYGL